MENACFHSPCFPLHPNTISCSSCSTCYVNFFFCNSSTSALVMVVVFWDFSYLVTIFPYQMKSFIKDGGNVRIQQRHLSEIKEEKKKKYLIFFFKEVGRDSMRWVVSLKHCLHISFKPLQPGLGELHVVILSFYGHWCSSLSCFQDDSPQSSHRPFSWPAS